VTRFIENSTWHKIIRKESRYLIQIVLTEKCNLSCVYCWQNHKQKTKFNYSTVLTTIHELLKSFNGTKRVCIHFFGGEPLLAFNVIKQLTNEVNRLWERENWPLDYLLFEITTNGTLLNNEIKNWLNKNKNVIPLLSLDGTPEMHNKNRCNSFDLIDKNLPFFSSYGNPVKMTISKYTIESMAEGIMFIHSIGLECNAGIVLENVWGSAKEKLKFLKIFESQLSQLVTFYLKNPELPRSTILPVLSIVPQQDNPRPASYGCGMGKNVISIDPDGKTFPCQRATEYYKNEQNEKPVLERTFLNPEGCVKCPLLSLCPECKANNLFYNKDANHKTTFHCEFFQLQLRASAILFLSEIKDLSKSYSKATLTKKDTLFLSQRLHTALFIEKYTRGLHRNITMN
jgi:uncharacterized protein